MVGRVDSKSFLVRPICRDRENNRPRKFPNCLIFIVSSLNEYEESQFL